MNYHVIIEADGASADQVHSARETFRRVLDAEFGSDTLFLRSFRASTKAKEQGLKSLTEDEDQDSAAWLRAFHKAETASKGVLRPVSASVGLRLDMP